MAVDSVPEKAGNEEDKQPVQHEFTVEEESDEDGPAPPAPQLPFPTMEEDTDEETDQVSPLY